MADLKLSVPNNNISGTGSLIEMSTIEQSNINQSSNVQLKAKQSCKNKTIAWNQAKPKSLIISQIMKDEKEEALNQHLLNQKFFLKKQCIEQSIQQQYLQKGNQEKVRLMELILANINTNSLIILKEEITLNLLDDVLLGVIAENITHINFSQCKIGQIQLNGFSLIKYLNLKQNHLKEIDLSLFVDLQDLILSNNQLQSISIEKSTKLQYLDVSYNEIKQLDLKNNIQLQSLYCQFNQLEHLNSIPFTLRTLNASNNKLFSIQLQVNDKIPPKPSKDEMMRFNSAADYISFVRNILQDQITKINLEALDASKSYLTEEQLKFMSSLNSEAVNMSACDMGDERLNVLFNNILNYDSIVQNYTQLLTTLNINQMICLNISNNQLSCQTVLQFLKQASFLKSFYCKHNDIQFSEDETNTIKKLWKKKQNKSIVIEI